MRYHVKLPPRNIAAELLIEDLKRVARKKRSNIISMEDYKRLGKHSVHPVISKFGSWLVALRVAGLDSPVAGAPTDEELFDNLKKVWRKLGKQPAYEHMKKPISKYWAAMYKRAFGTWSKALEMFDLYRKNRKKYRKELQKVIHRVRVRPHITPTLKYQMLRRDNFKCKACGTSPAIKRSVVLTIDHIKPLSRGGKTIPSNLQTLCLDCNIGKGVRKK